MKIRKNKVWGTLAGLLLISAGLLQWQSHGMERTLLIRPTDGYPTQVVDDREIGGGSISVDQKTPGKWHFGCELSPQYEWPFCELGVLLARPDQGLDLRPYDRIAIKAKYNGVGSHQMRIFLRNYNPAYSQPGRNESWKVMGAFIVPPADGVEVELPISAFSVASWWVAENKIPPEHAAMELDNVALIQFGSSTLMEPGHHDVAIDYIEFRGKWLTQSQILWLIGGLWVAGLGGLFLGRLRRVEHEMAKLDEAAHRDPLTGVRNRAGVLEEIDSLLHAGLARAGKPMGVIFADIDHFKDINDRHGHAVGDDVLKAFAHILQDEIRGSDYLVRWGGEEFVLFLPLSNLRQTELVAHKLQAALHQAAWPADLQVRASFGVTICSDGNMDTAIKRADQALYLAKNGGRDRVEVLEGKVSQAH